MDGAVGLSDDGDGAVGGAAEVDADGVVEDGRGLRGGGCDTADGVRLGVAVEATEALVDLADALLGHLEQRAVVGVEAVDLGLDVGRLGVDGGAEGGRAAVGGLGALGHLDDGLDGLDVGIGELSLGLIVDVGGGVAVVPAVALDVAAQSAELAQNDGPLLVVEIDVGRTVVVVQVEHVADALIVVAAAGGVDESGGVLLAGEADDVGRLKLSPALVERCPDDD